MPVISTTAGIVFFGSNVLQTDCRHCIALCCQSSEHTGIDSRTAKSKNRTSSPQPNGRQYIRKALGGICVNLGRTEITPVDQLFTTVHIPHVMTRRFENIGNVPSTFIGREENEMLLRAFSGNVPSTSSGGEATKCYCYDFLPSLKVYDVVCFCSRRLVWFEFGPVVLFVCNFLFSLFCCRAPMFS